MGALKYTIFLGGELVAGARLDQLISHGKFIAADSGMQHAIDLDLVPELWVGDFDSAKHIKLPSRYDQVEKQLYSVNKDSTDGELAILAALERGATELVLAGAFGGSRLDHIFAHLGVAIKLLEDNPDLKITLTSGQQEAYPLIAGSYEWSIKHHSSFSLLAFTDLEGVTISGAYWPLTNRKLKFGETVSLSNFVTEDPLAISFSAGRAILYIHYAERYNVAETYAEL